MEIIIGFGAGLALLYFWLLGHWFARVLTFLALAVAFGLGCGAWLDNPIGVLIGAAVAWPVSSIPVYRLRCRALDERDARHARDASLELALR